MHTIQRSGLGFVASILLALALLAACSSPPAQPGGSAPQFSVSLSPDSLTTNPGSTASTQLTVSGDYSGNLTLSLTDANGGAAPQGISISPSSVHVPGGPFTITVTVADSVAPGSYHLAIKAAGGNVEKSASFTLTVTASLDVALASNHLYVAQDDAGQDVTVDLSLSVTAIGVSGTMSLTLEDANGGQPPAGITLQTASVTVPGGPYQLTITVANGVNVGDYNLRLRAKLGSLEKTVDFTLTLQPPPEFTATIDSNPTIDVGASGTFYLKLGFLKAFNGTITITLESADGSPAPAAFTISPTNHGVAASAGDTVSVDVTLDVASSAEGGSYNLRLRASSDLTTAYADFTLTVPTPPDFTVDLSPYSKTVIKGGSATYQLSVYPHNGYSGTVQLSLTRTDSWPTFDGITLSPTSLDLSGGSVSTIITLSTDDSASVDDYHFQLKVSDDQTEQEASLALTVEDFDLSLGDSAPSLALDVGENTSLSATISVDLPSSLDSFPNPVTFSLITQDGSALPQGLDISPQNTDVSGGSNNVTINVSTTADTPVGNYDLRLVATAGGVSRSADFSLAVRGFNIGLQSGSLAFWTGESGSDTLTVTPGGGFTGTVNLSLENQDGTQPQGLSITPASVDVSSSNPVSQQITISSDSSVESGIYHLRLKAASGSIVQYADLDVTLADFQVSLDGTSLGVDQNSNGNLNLTVSPSNYSGNVQLNLVAQTGSSYPGGVTLSPSEVSVTSSTPLEQQLTLSATNSADIGTFNVRIEASATLNGVSRTRYADFTLDVNGFGISLSPSGMGLARGGSNTFTLTVNSHGANGTYSLGWKQQNDTSLPDGINFSPSSIDISSDGTTTHTITVSADSSQSYDFGNTYELVLTADSGSIQHTANFDLTIYRVTEFWTPRSSGTDYDLHGASYGNNTYVAVGGGQIQSNVSSGGVVVYSSNGTDWQVAGSDITNNELMGVTFGNGIFMAVGEACEAAASADGSNWTQKISAGYCSSDLNGVAYDGTHGGSNGTFVVVGDSAKILKSTDNGESWSTVTVSSTSANLNGVAFGSVGDNGYLVAVGDGGTILISDDGGSTWSASASGVSNDLRGVTYGDGVFVVVGDSGTVLYSSYTSSDGLQWHAPSGFGGTFDLYGVSYGYDWRDKGIFVAVGNSSNDLYTSRDGGVTWSQQNAGATGNALRASAYGNHRFVNVGLNGSLLTSP